MVEDEERTADIPQAEPSREDTPARAAAPEPVRMVPSARFVVDPLPIPPGIGMRDLPGFAEGEVEHLSFFPLEATAWGFLGGVRRSSADERILLYAAFREQVNGANDPAYSRRYAVLPGFAALQGRKWKRTTWICLLEPECVTLVRYRARATVPDYVRSRYGTALQENMEAAWKRVTQLLEGAPREPGDRVEPGLIRYGRPSLDRRGAVCFPLEVLQRPGAAWKRYGTGRVGPPSALLYADVRDRQFLGEERARRRAVHHLRGLVRAAAAGALLLGVFQIRYHHRNREAASLAAQVRAQQPEVEMLQQRETLARSATRLSEPPLEPFDRLLEMNDSRPEGVAFYSAHFDRDGNLGVTGEAPSVAIHNQYREALEKTGRYAGIELAEINSTKTGVRFTMRMKTGKGVSQPPAPGGEGT